MSDTEPRHHVHHAELGCVAILGVGLIGGSLGQVLCAIGAGDPVIGWDPDPAVRIDAVEEAAVHRMADSPEEAVKDADLVVLAGPLESILTSIHTIASHLKANAVVTDVASVKSQVVTQAESILGGRFVGGHPMSGSEESGIHASSVDLFDAAAWILTPTAQTDPHALAIVRRMVELAGASPRECSPDLHDSLVAFLSHLPHVLAYGLAVTAADGVPSGHRDIYAGSFRSGTRVAKSDPSRWAHILSENRANTLEALDGFLEWAQRARNLLAAGDESGLAALLRDSHDARKRFSG